MRIMIFFRQAEYATDNECYIYNKVWKCEGIIGVFYINKV